jgi:16S rRNA (cytosine967-C5)-methyltransferase
VLRRVGEQDEHGWAQALAPAAGEDPVGHLAMVHSHPQWIVQAFADALGGDLDEVAQALAADDARPLVHLLARPGQISAAELAASTGGRPAPYSPYGVHLADGGDPGELAPVREHLAQVQDEGSQLVTLALAATPLDGTDARWLDLCAGPGGKAALLGALGAARGAVLDAVEKAEHRARLVSQACAGLPVTVHVADGRDSGLPDRAYDRVLVDAPCTGLGALRRRPEARWRRQASDVPGLVRLQRELLVASLRLTRPGGVVAYVTCSPHFDETVGVVADVVRRTGAEQLDVRAQFPAVPRLGEGPHVQLWPHRHGTDAMFCALLRR